jgi:DNA invertase Pin-like site-specific DNA recombinase
MPALRPPITLEPQEDALSEAGCEELFSDVATGARSQRPGLDKAISVCRHGDTLVVWKLGRLGRSMSHLINTIQELEKKGVGFQPLTEQIDTTTADGRLIFHLFGALAEFERDLIRERVQPGLKSARARGRKGGRPPVPEKTKKMAKILLA